MDRRRWDDLPPDLRHAVQARCGTVTQTVLAPAGTNNAFAATLHTQGTAVFCKGIPSDADPWTIAMFERETAVATHLPADIAPRLLWHIQAGGWWLLGFEHLAGHPADFSPNSAHLPHIAGTLRTLSERLTPTPVNGQQPFSQRLAAMPIWNTYSTTPPAGLDPWSLEHLKQLAHWESAAPHHTTGHTLLHTDLNSHNWLITTSQSRIVDWAWTATGAAWIEPELLAPRLLAAGHHPDDAHRWVDHATSGATPSDTARTALAVAIAGIWTHRALTGRFHADLAAGARHWAQHRLALLDAPTPHNDHD